MARKGWNNRAEALCVNWSKQIGVNEQEHRKRGSRYKKLDNCMSLFNIITQITALTALINAIFKESADHIAIIIFVAVIESLVLINDGVDIVFDINELSQQHFTSANEYGGLSRLIDSTLSLEKNDRGKASSFLKIVRNKFNNILEESPDLPTNKMVDKLDTIIYVDPHTTHKTPDKTPEESDEEIDLESPKLDEYHDYLWNRMILSERRPQV